MTTKKSTVRTHVVPVFHDWDLRSVWKMIKPGLYVDEDDKLQSRPFERQPDGEPHHWDIVLVREDKSYHRIGDEDCDCDLTSGDMCPHWRLMRE